jgi:RNA polymerase sigma-70 factor (ECF subfamily)
MVSANLADPDLEREFEERLAESGTLAFRVAYAVLRNRADAEDVAQEAAVRAYRGFRDLRDQESFRAWIARIAWRIALDRRRSDSRRLPREQAVVEGAAPVRTVEDLAASRQLEERVWRAVDGLPEKLRVVVVLGAVEGHGLGEVAGLLGVPVGTVKSRLHEARRRLLEKLKWAVSDTKKS